jgi:hypothetical protein
MLDGASWEGKATSFRIFSLAVSICCGRCTLIGACPKMGGICETIVVLVEGSVNFPPGNVVDTNSSSRGRGEHARGREKGQNPTLYHENGRLQGCERDVRSQVPRES